MKIETLYKEIREALESCIYEDENVAPDLLLSIIKDISDETILRAIREFAKAPDATDYQLEEMIERADGLEEALSELEDKCPTCFGSGQRHT